MEFQIEVKELLIVKNRMTLTVMGTVTDPTINSHFLSNPKLVLHFNNGKEDRRIPFVLSNVTHIDGKCFFSGRYNYRLDLLFWKTRKDYLPFEMYMNLGFADFYEEYVKTTRELYDDGIELIKKNSHGYRNAIPLCEPMQFPPKDVPLDPYVFGALLGDGYLTQHGNSVIFSTADQEMLDNILDRLGRDKYNLVKTRVDTENHKDYAWTLKELHEGEWTQACDIKRILKSLGACCPAAEKFIPEEYKWASVDQRYELLRGLMDTDGTAHVGRFHFDTISEKLRDDFMYIARSLGFQVRYGVDYRPDKYPNSDGKCWGVAVLGHDADPLFALSRKKNDFKEYRDARKDSIEWPDLKDPIEYDNAPAIPDNVLPAYTAGVFLVRGSKNRYEVTFQQKDFDSIAVGIIEDYPDVKFKHRSNNAGEKILPWAEGPVLANNRISNRIIAHRNNTGYAVDLLERQIPEYYMKADLDTRLRFLKGVFDTRGRVMNIRLCLYSSNERMLHQLKQLLCSCGYTVEIRPISSKLRTLELVVMNPDENILTDPIRLKQIEYAKDDDPRKRSNFNDAISIVDIRPTDRYEEMTCISVADPSESYILDDFTVTHNSTLLHAIGVEDMWYWRGGLLMEPHGDLAMGLLRTAPPYRLHDIIYLNVLDPLASPGFNPLELPLNATDEMRAEATGTVTTLISKHFNMDATSMPRLAKMLTNALNALSWAPGATLLEIMDFYVNEDIRNTVLSFVPDGPSKDAMSDLAQNAKTEDLGTLENRISRFTTNRFMKHLFGQSHTTVNFFELMNEGKYIICPASKGGTSDDTFLKFYGSYIVSEVYKAAVMRESIEEGDRVNFALTLDEFQNFISDDIEGILSEARKYGLMMMLANQYLDQLTKPIQSAVLQNCATKLCYNLGPTDAPTMARALGFGLKAEDMQAIPKYHVMAAPLINGGPVHPFISAVFPPISLKSEVSGITASLIMEISRDKYMKNRNEIDKEIMDRKERFASGNKDAVRELMTKKNR